MTRYNICLFILFCSISNFLCSNKETPNLIKIKLLGSKIYAERSIYILNKSVLVDFSTIDTVGVLPSINHIEDSDFKLYLTCIEKIFKNLDTNKSDYRGVSISLLHETKILKSKSFYGKKNALSIIHELENGGVYKFDSTGSNVINSIKKNVRFYYK